MTRPKDETYGHDWCQARESKLLESIEELIRLLEQARRVASTLDAEIHYCPALTYHGMLP